MAPVLGPFWYQTLAPVLPSCSEKSDAEPIFTPAGSLLWTQIGGPPYMVQLLHGLSPRVFKWGAVSLYRVAEGDLGGGGEAPVADGAFKWGAPPIFCLTRCRDNLTPNLTPFLDRGREQRRPAHFHSSRKNKQKNPQRQLRGVPSHCEIDTMMLFWCKL